MRQEKEMIQMFQDKTAQLEEAVQKENSPGFSHLVRLFLFVFSKTKLISAVYIGAFLLLSLLRPALAFLWKDYIQTAEGLSAGQSLLPAAVLLLCYVLIHFLTNLISRYVYLLDDIEQLNIVQANRQQELLHSVMYRKMAHMKSEALEIPKLNDRVEQVFRFMGGRTGVNTSIMLQGYSIAAKAASVLSITAALYIFNPLLCLIVLIAPLPAVWVNTLGQNMMFQFKKNNTKLLRRAAYFEKLMLSPAAKELKTFALYDFFYGKWKAEADEYTQKEQEVIRARAKFMMLHNFIINLTIIAGSVLAVVLMVCGRLSLGELAAVLSLVSTLVGDVKELLTGYAGFVTKKNEAAQFFDFMDLPEREEGEACENIALIEAENLKYRYPLTDRYVLDGVSLTIRKGEKIAFVGENGMGKTTLVKILAGLLAPSEGRLKINGKEAEGYRCDSRYDRTAVMMQSPARYTTFTLGDNVFLGNVSGERDEEALDRALAFSDLGDKSKESLLGKDVGGVDLSGGEWQKLAIARTVYRDRDFMILDEPTSSLDPLAEAEIFRKYLAMAQDKTVIYVTHRISAAALADRIIVFDGGKIVQDGAHEELLREGGVYAKLYGEQAKWYSR